MKNKSASHTAPGFAKSLFMGIITLALAFVILSFITAIIIYNTENPTAKTELFSIISLALAGAIGAFINSKLFGKTLPTVPYLCSGAALAVFLIISLITCHTLTGGHLMSALCFAMVSIFAIFLAKNKKSAGRSRKKFR